MAVPGADWRKSIDTLRTEGADLTLNRSKIDDSLLASDSTDSPGVEEVRAAGVGPFADNTGKREVQVLNGIAETDDGSALEPPAIEVDTGRSAVTEWSDRTSNRNPTLDGNFGENDIYLCYLEPDSSVRRAVIVE